VSGVPEPLAPPRRWAALRGAAAALAFLTRIPCGRWLVLDADDVARAGPAFPLVGAGIGAAVGAVASALAGPLTPLLAVAVALALGALLTGALHLDALADSADALGARTRAQALAIMRDHAIGSYGAVAIAIDLLIRAAALTALVHHRLLAVAIAAGALSRLAPVVLAALLPYARSESGTGAPLTHGGRLRALAAGAIAVAIAIAAAGADGALLAGCAVALTLAAAPVLRRWLGGVTGDALGATLELTELAVLVIAVALVGAR
jgi:cobalamin 5'-phosphate synthase/cobalamin synthase